MDWHAEILAAVRRIESHVRRTPLEFSPSLSAAGDCRVYLKLENQQLTGSFKLRGAMNKLLSLDDGQRARGVVAASTGNHGAAVACGAAALGCRALIFAPTTAIKSKLEAITGYGGEVRFEGEDCVQAEVAARGYADREGMTYVSPYNDPAVVAGQGTIGYELLGQLPGLDAVFVSVGGGGLIGGIGSYLERSAAVEVVAASPKNSAVMEASLREGRVLDLPPQPTLSDGTAGGLESDTITFDVCRDVIDRFVLLTEDEIADGVRRIVRDHHMLIEGAAGAAVAAFLSQKEDFVGENVAIVLCGANIDLEVLKGILQ